MAVYAGDWTCYADVDYPQLPGEEFLVYARYDDGGYDGSGMVLFVRDGRLWEDHDSHCSCNGMWDDGASPEETTVEALLMRQEPELVAAVLAWVTAAFAAKVATLPSVVVNEPRAYRLRH